MDHRAVPCFKYPAEHILMKGPILLSATSTIPERFLALFLLMWKNPPPGVAYSFKFVKKLSIFSISSVPYLQVIYNFFGAINDINNQNKSHQFDLAIEKFGWTKNDVLCYALQLIFSLMVVISFFIMGLAVTIDTNILVSKSILIIIIWLFLLSLFYFYTSSLSMAIQAVPINMPTS